MSSASDQLLCPICSNPVKPDQKFCGNCGSTLRKTCAVCGTENPLPHLYCSNCGARLGEQINPLLSDETETGTAFHHDERRWATVLFADIAGFTDLSERMDAEDVKALAEKSAQMISIEIQRYDGSVLRMIGDEVLAVFGAPVAHEDDSERAVRAGIAIRDLDLATGDGYRVRVHVGINTGELIAGIIDPDGLHDYTVHGDTVNTAARIRNAAPPGCVLVGEQTYRETYDIVRYRNIPPLTAKGKYHPVAVWEAVEVIAAPRERRLTTAPFIGREDELERLENMWRRVASQSLPHLVTILGEPGIGKSRLVAEFERRLPPEVVVLHGRCLPYGDTMGYWSLAMILKEAAKVTVDDDNLTTRVKLGDQVKGTMLDMEEAEEIARHLALMTGLDLEEDRSGGLPDQRVLHNSFRRYFEAFARHQPLCLICDDIHWANDSLLDLIEYIAGRTRQARLFIITQARPELLDKRNTWGKGVRSFTSLMLASLNENQEQELIVALLKERGLALDLYNKVSRSVGGNPLFAEELVAMIAEGGDSNQVPSFLKMLIAARLDALPSEMRQSILFASIFGKTFWEKGLLALGNTDDEGQLDVLLEGLELKDLVREIPQSQLRSSREFTFKHDLIRDVAYEMLPKAERRKLHGRAVEWLEQSLGDQLETYLDHLAHHAKQAGQHLRAIDYLQKAAERAKASGVFRQAAILLSNALPIAEELDRQDLVEEVLMQRARAYCNVGMWLEARQDLRRLLDKLPSDRIELLASIHLDLAECSTGLLQGEDIRFHAQKALEFAEQAGRDDLAAAALAHQGVVASSDGDLTSSIDLYQRSFQRSQGRLAGPASAHSFLVIIHYWLGSFDSSLSHAELLQQQIQGDISAQLELHGNLGLAFAALGRYREAQETFSEGLRLAREYEFWPYVARMISTSTGYHLDLYDFTAHEALAQEARQVAKQNDFMTSYVSASIDLLFNYTRIGEVGKAERLMPEVAEAIQGASGFHSWLWQLRFKQAQAEISMMRNEWENAFHLAEEAIAQSQKKGRIKYHIMGLETRAKALAALGQTSLAKANARQAVELARTIREPARLLQAALTLLELEEDETLVQEAFTTARSIEAALPEGELRQNFLQAEPIANLIKLFHEQRVE
jgi:class 3 adenylate cyclase/tetratricopeptide (TPR) repeat protein